jgi:hemerythrin-like metal-binding protein
MDVITEVPGWTQAASVNVKLFDLQHQHLFQLIDHLETEMSGGRGRDKMVEFLTDVADYAAEHFATEEAVMRAYEFPWRDAHAQEHRKLTAMVAKFRAQEESGDAALSVAVMRGLRKWIIWHVQGTDKLYTEFLNSRGFC